MTQLFILQLVILIVHYRQISNTQWKKYVETGKDQQRGMLDTSNGGSGRRIDQKKPGVLGSPSIPNNAGFGYSGGPGPNSGAGVNGSHHSGINKRPERKLGTAIEKRDAKGNSSQGATNGESRKLQNPKTAPSNFGFNGKRTSISSVSSTGSNRNSTSSGKTKQDLNGVNIVQDSASSVDGRRDISSHSLERPRTKIKVSGGTQTTNDLQYLQGSPNVSSVHSDGEYSSNSLGRKYQVKSYSLNGPAAAQLSQNVRERIMQSPYGKVHIASDFNAGGSPFASPYYRERSPRIKATDGSLSDSPYTNFTDLQYTTSPYSSPYMWASRGNYPGSVASAPTT